MTPAIFSQLASLTELSNGQQLAPRQLYSRVMHKAWVLQQKGVRAQHRVVIAHGNSSEFFSDLFALWVLRASAVPVHPTLTSPEIQKIVEVTGARFVVTKKAGFSGPQALHTTDDFGPTSKAVEAPSWPGDSEECLVLFSSGSSGQPKGVRHSWGSLAFRIAEIQRRLGPVFPRKTLCFLPTSFGHGLIANCLAPWLGGSELLLLPDFNPLAGGEFSPLIEREGIEFFSSVPSIWKILQRGNLPSGVLKLRQVHCASAPLDSETQGFMREWCGTAQIINVYGLTEAATWVAGSPLSNSPIEAGYIGEPWAAEFKIFTDGRLHAQPGVEGEVFLRTQSLMMSYLGGQDARFQDGYFGTGDLGALDSQGHLYLRGRLADEINRGGTKVSPAEVRECLEAHASVKQAWVGAIDDPLWGKTVGTVIIPHKISDFDLNILKAWSVARLAPIKQPSRWLVSEGLPLLANGKLDVRKILALFTPEIKD